MRLIDADALIAKQANIAKTFARSDAQKSLMGRVMYNTESAPTIDAIPIEWLEAQISQFRDKLKDEAKGVFNVTVREIIYRWQKEQEAQDGKA